MDNFLEPGNTGDANALLEKLILEQASAGGGGIPSSGQVPCTKIIPKAGFCLKTKNDKQEKVFLNICKSENVPEAKDITEQELLDLLESDDPTGFRIPMSIGEGHAEVDKGGKGCTAYDVVVNPKFYEKMLTSELFKTFFLTVTMEGVESKYDQQLSRDWTILKNRKFVGTLPEQNIRNQSKPLIMEMDEISPKLEEPKPLIQVVDNRKQEEMKSSRAPEPSFTIIQEPANDYPEFLVAEIHLPKVKTAKTLTLDVGEDRILLTTRSNAYHLDVYLPFNIIQDECGSQFNRQSKTIVYDPSLERSSFQ